ncbi:MAG: GNAT family N-acetyltransferase [Candidatus Microsaccharimonas sp.]
MRFEPLSSENAKLIKEWFIKPIPENRFIQFYEDTDKWMRLIHDSDDRYGYIVYKDEQMIGFADIELEGDTASTAIGIKPELRGQGLGKELMKAIFDLPILHNVHKLIGGVETDNIASTRMLLSLGYVQGEDDEGVIEFTRLI